MLALHPELIGIKPYAAGTNPDAFNAPPSPAQYRRALSPYGAARLGEKPVSMKRVVDYVLKIQPDVIEGIGGVLVPLDSKNTWLDFHARFRWPAVIIARAGLGTINHTLLTIEALCARKIPILGFILNAPVPTPRRVARENSAIIEKFSRIESLGLVPYSRNVRQAWTRGVRWEAIWRRK